VFKPRDQWHTFWNAGDSPCRILEIISSAGFEHYFEEVAEGQAGPALSTRYGLETDPTGTSRILEQFNLVFPRPRR